MDNLTEISRLKRTGAIPQDVGDDVRSHGPTGVLMVMLGQQNEEMKRQREEMREEHNERQRILQEVSARLINVEGQLVNVLAAQKHTNGDVNVVRAEVSAINERHKKEDEQTLKEFIVHQATAGVWMIPKWSISKVAMVGSGIAVITSLTLGGVFWVGEMIWNYVASHWKP